MRLIGTTAVITDSASYLPASVRSQFGITVVPMHVSLDGKDYREFVDLDSETFYRALDGGAKVQTSQASPGEFAEVYARVAAGGAEQALSIHIGSALSGTVNSARLGAQDAPLLVRIVDTGQASFVEGLAAWAACDAISRGASLDEASEEALAASKRTGNVFLVRGTRLLEQGGRFVGAPADERTVPVLALVDGAVRPIAQADSRENALSALVTYLEANAVPGSRLRIGISNGNAAELATELEQRVGQSRVASQIEFLAQYEVGPAVGAHTGSGCTGIVFESRRS